MKRILQVALVLVLALGVFSVRGVLAENSLNSLAQAISSASNGDTIKLTENISLSSPLMIENKNLTIDLNGKTIQLKTTEKISAIEISKSTVSFIGDGKIQSDYNGLKVKDDSKVTLNGNISIIVKHNGVTTSGKSSLTVNSGVSIKSEYIGVLIGGGTFTMDGGTISAEHKTGSDDATALYFYLSSGYNAVGNISGGTIEAKSSTSRAYGITVWPTSGLRVDLNISGGNISQHGNDGSALTGNGTSSEKTVINITGGSLYAENTGIYHPQVGDITIGGRAEVFGGSLGIEMRSGNLIVKDYATIVGGRGETSSTPNGSGSTTENAAIAVAQHTTKNDISVNITGGSMQATSALYVSNPQGNKDTDGRVSVRISEDAKSVTIPRFAGVVEINDKRVATPFITGGLFTKEVKEGYISTGYSQTKTTDSTYLYRVSKLVTPEDKPLPDAPAPMPNEVKDVTAKANTEAAQQGMNVKADSDDIKNVGNNDLKEDEKASGAWIWLTVEPNKVENEKDRTPIQNTLKGTSQIGVWMNISLFKQVVGESQSKIPETQSPIELSIQLDSKLLMPKEKQNTHRYVVYRYHGGKVERLDTKFDAKTNTLTFSTDKFSTYALVYEEIPVEPEVTPVPVVPDMPQTGDGSQLVLFAALLGVSVMGLLLLAKRRRA